MQLASAPFSLEACLEGAVLPLRAIAGEKGISLSLNIEPSVRGAFIGDRLRISQIVAHLVSNAVKFTSVGGVTVDVRAQADDDHCMWIDLVVGDTGPGLTDDMRERLFKRFSQLDGESISDTGTGLGLAISLALAQLMEGEIALSSTVGVGSEFTFRVRLARAPEPLGSDQLPTVAHLPGLQSDKLSVLVAEDHPVSRRAMEVILASASAEVRAVENGREAVDAFAAGRFDLVLMDKRMPELDGLSATRAIRELEKALGRPTTPILMLSADASDHDLEAAMSAGCSGHLAKPVTPEALLTAIDHLISKSHGH
jgi:two-component system, sensor histidine kinase